MEKIQLVDLKNQYLKIKEEIDSAVLNVVESTAYINGPEVHAFREELENYLDVKHVIPCANGTDALQIAIMALDIQPGDEVITPSFTFISTTEIVALLGITPVFVDVDPNTFTVDTEDLKEKITPKTKAIIPVHLYGQCANMEEIMSIAEENNIAVIEDTAQAIGAEFTFTDGRVKKAGTIGTIGTTSFFPSKNLGCFGDGGALFTNDDDLAAKIRLVANHGQSRRYYHDVIGVNSRLDSIQAAILRVKLRYLDEYNKNRQEAAAKYNRVFNELPELTTPYVAPNSTHVYHQYTLKLNGIDRSALSEYLSVNGIPNNIYYPLANHKQKAFTDKYGTVTLPVTEQLSEEVLSLPMHTELTDEQIDHITSHVKSFIEANRK